MRRSLPWRASPPLPLPARPEPAATPESSASQYRPSVSYDLPVRVHTMQCCYIIRAKTSHIPLHCATTHSGSVYYCRKNRAHNACFYTHRYTSVCPVPRRPAPLDTADGQRTAFPLDPGLRHESAFRRFSPSPARRPASAGRPKACVYLAAIVVRRPASPQSIASTVQRGAAFARRGSRFSRGESVSELMVLKFGGTSVADA